MMKRLLLVSFLAIGGLTDIRASLDNRYLFPLNQHLFMRSPKKQSDAWVRGFFMTASQARDENGCNLTLPMLGGTYDLAAINSAMNSVGLTNPWYLSEWGASEIPFGAFGKLRSSGVAFALEYQLFSHCSLGAAFSLMHASSRSDYCVTQKTREAMKLVYGDEWYPGRERALEQARLGVNKTLGLCSGRWSATGVSDLDFYVRLGGIEEYLWKFRQVDASVTLGAIAPTGKKRKVYDPASFPFDGNGLWGAFIKGDLSLELTDDWYFGLWLYTSKRFSKTQISRMPMAREPLAYGVLVDNARINPGITVAASPYLVLDDLYDGFGAYAQYAYIHHTHDFWQYSGRCSPNLSRLNCAGYWTNEFLSFGLDYDFTKRTIPAEYGPRFFMDCIVPVQLFNAQWVAKTYQVSLGVEFNF